jgi:hypothetical protein
MSAPVSHVGRFWRLRWLDQAVRSSVIVDEVVAGGCRCAVSQCGGSVGGSAASIAVYVHLEDGRVVDQPVDGGDGDGLIGKDAVPGAEGLVGGDGEASGLVAPGDELEEDGGLGLVLLGVANPCSRRTTPRCSPSPRHPRFSSRLSRSAHPDCRATLRNPLRESASPGAGIRHPRH